MDFFQKMGPIFNVFFKNEAYFGSYFSSFSQGPIPKYPTGLPGLRNSSIIHMQNLLNEEDRQLKAESMMNKRYG